MNGFFSPAGKALAMFLILTAAVYPSLLSLGQDRSTIQSLEDSLSRLYRLIPEAEGERRLELYKNAKILARTQLSADSLLMLYDAYRQEARKQKNIAHEGDAVVGKLEAYMDNGLGEKFMNEVDEALAFFERNGEWDRYYQICHTRVGAIHHYGKYEDALAVSRATYDYAKAHGHTQGIATALSDMARSYQGMGLLDDAMGSYQESVALFDKEPPGWIGSVALDTYQNYIGVLGEKDLYTEALAVCGRYEALWERYKQEGYTSAATDFNIASVYVSTYAGLKDYAKAEFYLDRMARSPITNIELGKLNLLHTRMQVRYAQKRYRESVLDADTMLGALTRMGDMRSVSSVLSNKAMVTYEGGLYREAADTYKEWKQLSDSLRAADNAGALNDLRTQYEVDKLTAEKQRQRLVAAWAITGCGLLTLVVLVYAVYSRRIRRKNLTLYAQLREAIQNREKSEQVLSAVPEEQLPREMLLFRRLNERVKKEKLFTDPSLNRKALAEAAGTNEIYIAEAIREATGLTVAAYIAELRLRYSLELLASDPSLTLEAIAADSGHGSYSAFFRIFTKQYGITPSEYRRLSMAKKPE